MNKHTGEHSKSQNAADDNKLHMHSKDAEIRADAPQHNPAAESCSSSVAEAGPDAAKALYDQVKDSAIAATKQASDAVSGGLETGSRYLRDGGTQAAEQVRMHPTETLLVAGAIGLIVGMILAR